MSLGGDRPSGVSGDDEPRAVMGSFRERVFDRNVVNAHADNIWVVSGGGEWCVHCGQPDAQSPGVPVSVFRGTPPGSPSESTAAAVSGDTLVQDRLEDDTCRRPQRRRAGQQQVCVVLRPPWPPPLSRR